MIDLQKAKETGNFRELKKTETSGKFITFEGQSLLNLASNDYMGIGTDKGLRNQFLQSIADSDLFFGSGASRLVYTSSNEFDSLEFAFEQIFQGKKGLIFNSGYSANLGTIASLADESTLFIADKLIHASMIDALVISKANFKRFTHNDMDSLESMLKKYAGEYKQVVVLTEAVFSMDGDIADLRRMVELKKQYDNVRLYVDEAHSFFSVHEHGVAKDLGLDRDIDILLITFSKALGGNGAILMADGNIRDILVNSARSLIFSTALSSVQVAWTRFILSQDFSGRRENLKNLVKFMGLSETQICPFIVGENDDTLALAAKLRKEGFFVPAIRPPTVPLHTSRLRISLRGDLLMEDVAKFKEILDQQK